MCFADLHEHERRRNHSHVRVTDGATASGILPSLSCLWSVSGHVSTRYTTSFDVSGQFLNVTATCRGVVDPRLFAHLRARRPSAPDNMSDSGSAPTRCRTVGNVHAPADRDVQWQVAAPVGQPDRPRHQAGGEAARCTCGHVEWLAATWIGRDPYLPATFKRASHDQSTPIV